MADSVEDAAKAKPRSRKKTPAASASLPPEIDSAGRTCTATRILVNLPKSTASAPANANANETPLGAEFPVLDETRAVTTDGTPLAVPFSHEASESGSGLPALQTVLGSSLSGVESETSETETKLTCLPTPPDEQPLLKPNFARVACTTS
ncbi:hypothetical protein B0H14DRAFT_2641313 [Mycena olivaceomarginata]|nr:hypothetical protein B0H14DRAFT_2641313 [Mycena olivaceomarginata]